MLWYSQFIKGNSKIAPPSPPPLAPTKKQGLNSIWTHGLCVSAAVLYQLSYEDPAYNAGEKSKTEWRWYELQAYKSKWRGELQSRPK